MVAGCSTVGVCTGEESYTTSPGFETRIQRGPSLRLEVSRSAPQPRGLTEGVMAYRNKTFVSFASDDIRSYRLMEAWRESKHIAFDFHDAHDLNTALDTSQPDTIRRRLRERLGNTKQVVLLVGAETRSIAARPSRFLHYEVEVIERLGLPVVFANLNGSRVIQRHRLPVALLNAYTVSVSFQPAIIKYALDNYVDGFPQAKRSKAGPHQYPASVYQRLSI